MRRVHHVMLAGSFGEFAGKVIRIGHMGENARPGSVLAVMRGLDETLSALGAEVSETLAETFLRVYSGDNYGDNG